ncbi:MAG: cytochrome b/b6 domain-containing protein [Desulfosarcinaceae bacterium]|jgi:cytochrome b
MPEKKNTAASSRQSNDPIVRVWDLPTRLFHWLLVFCVAVSVVTGRIGGLYMRYHEWSGVTILVLILFRIVWGVVGGRHARFAAFVAGPKAVVGYARDLFGEAHRRYLGHNPLGGWSILAMLVALGVQAGTGLFANDDIFTEGPLAHWISKGSSDLLTRIHLFNKGVLLMLVGVHLLAVVFYYLVKRENLLVPMITGYKRWPQAVEDTDNGVIKAAVILIVLALCAYLVIY